MKSFRGSKSKETLRQNSPDGCETLHQVAKSRKFRRIQSTRSKSNLSDKIINEFLESENKQNGTINAEREKQFETLLNKIQENHEEKDNVNDRLYNLEIQKYRVKVDELIHEVSEFKDEYDEIRTKYAEMKQRDEEFLSKIKELEDERDALRDDVKRHIAELDKAKNIKTLIEENDIQIKRATESIKKKQREERDQASIARLTRSTASTRNSSSSSARSPRPNNRNPRISQLERQNPDQ